MNIVRETLTPQSLLDLQASMTKGTLKDPTASGRFRNKNKQNVVVDSDDQVLYVPPPAREIETRIESLCTYANEEQSQGFVHPVIKGIILHFWLAYVHPFGDGNGRTARALFYWYMLRNGYWLFEYLSISRAIIRAPAQYARAYLYSEKDEQDLTYFIAFHLRTIRTAIEGLRSYLAKQQGELKEARKALRGFRGLNHRQSQTVYHALSHPDGVYTVESYTAPLRM